MCTDAYETLCDRTNRIYLMCSQELVSMSIVNTCTVHIRFIYVIYAVFRNEIFGSATFHSFPTPSKILAGLNCSDLATRPDWHFGTLGPSREVPSYKLYWGSSALYLSGKRGPIRCFTIVFCSLGYLIPYCVYFPLGWARWHAGVCTNIGFSGNQACAECNRCCTLRDTHTKKCTRQTRKKQ